MANRFIVWRAGLTVLMGGLAACSASGTSPPASTDARATCGAASVIVATSDYTSSEVGTLGIDGGATFYTGGNTLGSDPALASSAGRLFWVDRSGGNVLELDPECGTVIQGPWTTSDDGGGSTNPQDIAVDPATGNLWIARFMVSTLLVKSSDGRTDLGRIDLSQVTMQVTGMPMNPYMSSVRIVGGKAYVALEMLDPYPYGIQTSYLAKLDVATALQTGKIEKTLQLKGRNPFGLMVEYESALYLAEPGDVDKADETNAGIERVDLGSFSSDLIVVESEIGASVDEISITAGCGTAIVMGPQTNYNPTSLISFNPTTGTILTPLSQGLLFTDAGFDLAGMAWVPGGVNLVGDRSASPSGKGYAVHVLSASSSCDLTVEARTLFAALPPVALVPVP